MRKMFSKNQIEKIVNDNEVLSRIEYDPEDASLNIESLLYLSGYVHFSEYVYFQNLTYFENPSAIHFNQGESTLQDKLDEKSGKLYLHKLVIANSNETEISFSLITRENEVYTQSSQLEAVINTSLIIPITYYGENELPLISIAYNEVDKAYSGRYFSTTLQQFTNFVINNITDSVFPL